MVLHAPPRTSSAPQPVGPAPRRFAQAGIGTAVGLVLLGVLLLVALGVVGLTVGVDAMPAATVLALIPLAGVMGAVLWFDRWEREPWPALATAFGWGASVAVLIALVLNTGAQFFLMVAGATETDAAVFGATVVAPVVEESAKAAGVLLIFFVWRRTFDGPVDGLVYGATVGAGFAFVENILYFGRTMAESAALQDDGTSVAMVFLLRAVMSPFAHLMFTCCTGLALGFAARRRWRQAWVLALPVGLGLAMVLHGLWNGSATVNSQSGFFTVYLLVQVPLFAAAVALALAVRHHEAGVVRTRLTEYAAAGWLAPVEVVMLSSLRERRRARGWASARGGASAGRAMRDFQLAASRLAHQRERLVRRPDADALLDERLVLGELTGARSRLMATVSG